MIRDGHFVPVSPALACRGTSEEEGQGALLLLPSESPWTGLVLRPRGVRGRPPSPSVSVEPRERGVGGLLFVVGLVLLERFPHYYFFPLPPPSPVNRLFLRFENSLFSTSKNPPPARAVEVAWDE